VSSAGDSAAAAGADLLAGELAPPPNVKHDGVRVEASLVDLLGGHQMAGVGRAGREGYRALGRRLRRQRAAFGQPLGQAALQDPKLTLLAVGPQHQPDPADEMPALVVVANQQRLVADADCLHRRFELVGRGDLEG
jgi:hypothetical protein